MNAELYYLVGKPNSLKQSLVSVLRESLSGHSSIMVPQIFTTDELVATTDNYTYIDERNFLLRQSMDIFTLSWEKKGHLYGVSGDLSQRLNSGVDVILNGSLHNQTQARNHFPNLSTVLIQKYNGNKNQSDSCYLIAEDDEVTLEWDSQDTKMGQPYVLTLMSDHGMDKALEMMLTLVTYNRNCLDYTG